MIPQARSHAGLLVLATIVAYLPSLGGDFQFDDYNVIVNYPTVHSWTALFERLGGGVRPLLKASYALNWTSGLGAPGFHFLNIAVHALNAALLYFIGRGLCERWLGAREAARFGAAVLVAALMFALHPVQTEAVTYVSGRSSSLMASFYLGAVLLYLRGGSWFVPWLLFVMAIAVKETALTLPAVLLLVELCGSPPLRWKAMVRRQWPYWLVVLAAPVLLVNPHYRDLVSWGFTERGPIDNLVAQLDGIGYLLSRLVLANGFNIDPALAARGWSADLAVPAALLAALAALGLASLRRRPWVGFGLLWFFLQLAPTNSIVPRLDVANERQLYLACWGLFFALAVQIGRMELPRLPAAIAAGLLLAAFAAVGVVRQIDYWSEVRLWQSSVRESPWNARAWNNLGYAYQQTGRIDEARAAYRRALVFRPDYMKARVNLRLLQWDEEARQQP